MLPVLIRLRQLLGQRLALLRRLRRLRLRELCQHGALRVRVLHAGREDGCRVERVELHCPRMPYLRAVRSAHRIPGLRTRAQLPHGHARLY